jgi:hypothetical protein
MGRELREDAIVDSFKQDLSNMKFIEANLHKDISEKLDILASSRSQRHEKVEAAKEVWKLLFRSSLSNITTNTRGYEQACSYYDEFCKYENLLFAIDENHRDHVLHSIWVMLLGIYLCKYFTELSKKVYCISFVPSSQKASGEFEAYKLKVWEYLKQYETPLWCLIALTHDLGYPIEKTRIANSVMAKMVSNFGFLERTDFKYNFGVVHETAIGSLLTILTTNFVLHEDRGYYTEPDPGLRLDFAKSFERLDHGIMGAYLLTTTLDWICETLSVDTCLPFGKPGDKQLAQRAALNGWLEAIAAHTSSFRYWTHFEDIGFLLFLCDQLDEFSRFSLDRNSKDWTKVGCRTEFSLTDKLMEIKHTLDNENVSDEVEDLFKKKVAALRDRIELDSSSKMNRISIICTDVRKACPITLTYEKYRDKLSGELVKSESGSSTTDILGFLNGTVKLR